MSGQQPQGAPSVSPAQSQQNASSAFAAVPLDIPTDPASIARELRMLEERKKAMESDYREIDGEIREHEQRYLSMTPYGNITIGFDGLRTVTRAELAAAQEPHAHQRHSQQITHVHTQVRPQRPVVIRDKQRLWSRSSLTNTTTGAQGSSAELDF
ncbi:MAG: hypothetical protein MHM6MM_006425 [Cercozoa sp. M6MM]